MYGGVGLLTPRGTGTSGYVQTNKFNLRHAPVPKFEDGQRVSAPEKKANRDILEHNRKRKIEVALLELQDELEEEGLSREEIEEQVEARRKQLIAEYEAENEAGADGAKLSNETHAVAARKEQQLEKMRRAFGLTDEGKAPERGKPAEPQPGGEQQAPQQQHARAGGSGREGRERERDSARDPRERSGGGSGQPRGSRDAGGYDGSGHARPDSERERDRERQDRQQHRDRRDTREPWRGGGGGYEDRGRWDGGGGGGSRGYERERGGGRHHDDRGRWQDEDRELRGSRERSGRDELRGSRERSGRDERRGRRRSDDSSSSRSSSRSRSRSRSRGERRRH